MAKPVANNVTTLEQIWEYRRQELAGALSQSHFYLELLIIGLSLTVAWLAGLLIRRLIGPKLEHTGLAHLSQSFFGKPSTLLTPLLSILLLSAAKPIAEEYAGGSAWLLAVFQLCVAWLFAQLILLIVRNRPVAWFIVAIILIYSVLDVTGFMASISDLLDSMAISVGKYKVSMLNVVNGLIIFVIVFWLAAALSRSLSVYLQQRSSLSYNARSLIVKFFTIFVYFIAFMITLNVIGVDLTALAVFSGALGVGVGLGLQRLTANFVSGVTLLIEKSIKIGDLIEVDQFTGWVRQLNMRYTLIETFDGRELLVPNEQLVTTRVTNWTYSNDLARVDILVSVHFDSDPALVQKLLLEAALSCPKTQSRPAPTCHLKEFIEQGMQFALDFWIPNIKEGRAGPRSQVMCAIVEKFQQHGIAWARPQAPFRLADGHAAP